MTDAGLLRQFADKIKEYGHDIGHWGSIKTVIADLRRIADNIDASAMPQVAKELDASEMIRCENCGKALSAHALVNFADGQQIGKPVLVCLASIYSGVPVNVCRRGPDWSEATDVESR